MVFQFLSIYSMVSGGNPNDISRNPVWETMTYILRFFYFEISYIVCHDYKTAYCNQLDTLTYILWSYLGECKVVCHDKFKFVKYIFYVSQ